MSAAPRAGPGGSWPPPFWTLFVAGIFLARALVEEGTLISSTYHQGTWGRGAE